MSVGNSEGTRRCDARCYSASKPDCDCICGGKNHAAGLAVASKQTAEWGRAMLEDFAAKGSESAAEILKSAYIRPAGFFPL